MRPRHARGGRGPRPRRGCPGRPARREPPSDRPWSRNRIGSAKRSAPRRPRSAAVWTAKEWMTRPRESLLAPSRRCRELAAVNGPEIGGRTPAEAASSRTSRQIHVTPPRCWRCGVQGMQRDRGPPVAANRPVVCRRMILDRPARGHDPVLSPSTDPWYARSGTSETAAIPSGGAGDRSDTHHDGSERHGRQGVHTRNARHRGNHPGASRCRPKPRGDLAGLSVPRSRGYRPGARLRGLASRGTRSSTWS